MMEGSIYAYIVTAVLGGGLFKGIEALIRAFSDSKEKINLAQNQNAKTPAEIESVSIATMTTALASAQNRITALEKERETDQLYYQNRIKELNTQLNQVREALATMETKMAALVDEANHRPIRPEVS